MAFLCYGKEGLSDRRHMGTYAYFIEAFGDIWPIFPYGPSICPIWGISDMPGYMTYGDAERHEKADICLSETSEILLIFTLLAAICGSKC